MDDVGIELTVGLTDKETIDALCSALWGASLRYVQEDDKCAGGGCVWAGEDCPYCVYVQELTLAVKEIKEGKQ